MVYQPPSPLPWVPEVPSLQVFLHRGAHKSSHCLLDGSGSARVGVGWGRVSVTVFLFGGLPLWSQEDSKFLCLLLQLQE